MPVTAPSLHQIRRIKHRLGARVAAPDDDDIGRAAEPVFDDPHGASVRQDEVAEVNARIGEDVLQQLPAEIGPFPDYRAGVECVARAIAFKVWSSRTKSSSPTATSPDASIAFAMVPTT